MDGVMMEIEKLCYNDLPNGARFKFTEGRFADAIFADAIFVKFGKYCFSDARSGCVYTDNDVDERSVIRCD